MEIKIKEKISYHILPKDPSVITMFVGDRVTTLPFSMGDIYNCEECGKPTEVSKQNYQFCHLVCEECQRK